MKISEFAKETNVTTKMLRYYDEIGLLKPDAIDEITGYREYDMGQQRRLDWILILKDLGFTLAAIKVFLEENIEPEALIMALRLRRIRINDDTNQFIQKKMLIDKLILFIEKEGFAMNKTMNIMNYDENSVNELKKNIANMEVFLESTRDIMNNCEQDVEVGFIRLDIAQFKQVNDLYGYEVGDRVIWEVYLAMSNQIKAFNEKATLARAHGDEFIACVVGTKELIGRIAQDIIEAVSAIDYESLGCMEKKGCYIGLVVTKEKELSDTRKNIDYSIDALIDARRKGINSLSFYTGMDQKVRR